MPDGPGGFRRDFSCPAVLRILLESQSVSLTGLSPSLARLPIRFCYQLHSHFRVLQPHCACTMVWAPPVSLAATQGIDFSFSSCRYLDVSVLCVYLAFAYCSSTNSGFPHSDISGPLLTYSSPKHFVVRHVLRRLLVPRHSPCALCFLTTFLRLLRLFPLTLFFYISVDSVNSRFIISFLLKLYNYKLVTPVAHY